MGETEDERIFVHMSRVVDPVNLVDAVNVSVHSAMITALCLVRRQAAHIPIFLAYIYHLRIRTEAD
jgi:hypothetical protein